MWAERQTRAYPRCCSLQQRALEEACLCAEPSVGAEGIGRGDQVFGAIEKWKLEGTVQTVGL